MTAPITTRNSAPQRFLVTGAGSGIGLAITRALAGLGHHVFAGARRDVDLAMLATLPHVTPLALDLNVAAHVAAATCWPGAMPTCCASSTRMSLAPSA